MIPRFEDHPNVIPCLFPHTLLAPMAPSQTEEYDLAVATYREAVETLRPAEVVEPKS